MNSSWYKTPLIVPLFLIIIGIIFFLYQAIFISGKVVLEEKTFSLGDKVASILAPKNSEQNPVPNISGVAFRNGGDVLLISAATVGPIKLVASISCNMMKRTTAFTVYITSLNQETEVCDEPINLSEHPEYQGYKQLMTSSLVYEGIGYAISVIAKENYLNSQEGKGKVKQIFESFTIK